MGHGCYYTNKETGSRAFWIDLDYSEQIDEETGLDYANFAFGDTILNLGYELQDIGYEQMGEYEFCNGLYYLILESGYGGKVVIRLEPKGSDRYYYDDIRIYNLAMANHERCYARIGRELLKIGYKLRIASSGYTSTEYINA